MALLDEMQEYSFKRELNEIIGDGPGLTNRREFAKTRFFQTIRTGEVKRYELFSFFSNYRIYEDDIVVLLVKFMKNKSIDNFIADGGFAFVIKQSYDFPSTKSATRTFVREYFKDVKFENPDKDFKTLLEITESVLYDDESSPGEKESAIAFLNSMTFNFFVRIETDSTSSRPYKLTNKTRAVYNNLRKLFDLYMVSEGRVETMEGEGIRVRRAKYLLGLLPFLSVDIIDYACDRFNISLYKKFEQFFLKNLGEYKNPFYDGYKNAFNRFLQLGKLIGPVEARELILNYIQWESSFISNFMANMRKHNVVNSYARGQEIFDILSPRIIKDGDYDSINKNIFTLSLATTCKLKEDIILEMIEDIAEYSSMHVLRRTFSCEPGVPESYPTDKVQKEIMKLSLIHNVKNNYFTREVEKTIEQIKNFNERELYDAYMEQAFGFNRVRLVLSKGMANDLNMIRRFKHSFYYMPILIHTMDVVNLGYDRILKAIEDNIIWRRSIELYDGGTLRCTSASKIQDLTVQEGSWMEDAPAHILYDYAMYVKGHILTSSINHDYKSATRILKYNRLTERECYFYPAITRNIKDFKLFSKEDRINFVLELSKGYNKGMLSKGSNYGERKIDGSQLGDASITLKEVLEAERKFKEEI